MRKFSFLERPRPSPETARTAGSCVSAEGHMTPAVSPAFSFVLRRALKIGPNLPRKPQAWQELYPVPKEGTQRLTLGHMGRSRLAAPSTFVSVVALLTVPVPPAFPRSVG